MFGLHGIAAQEIGDGPNQERKIRVGHESFGWINGEGFLTQTAIHIRYGDSNTAATAIGRKYLSVHANARRIVALVERWRSNHAPADTHEPRGWQQP